jgi:predicted secreted protein
VSSAAPVASRHLQKPPFVCKVAHFASVGDGKESYVDAACFTPISIYSTHCKGEIMEKKRAVIAGLVIALLSLTVVVAGCTSSTSNNNTSTAPTQTNESAPMTKTANSTNVTSGESITAAPGRNFTISLRSNPSTGYRWGPQFDRTALSLVDSVFISDPNPHNLVGVPGSQIFTFQGLAKGTTTITFNNISPSQIVTDQVTCTVTVT